MVFSRIDPAAGASLAALGVPTAEALPDIAAIIGCMRCDAETFFVIDNFHTISAGLPDALINVLSGHNAPHLHIVLITQQPGLARTRARYNDRILFIGQDVFPLAREDTDAFFKQYGLRLPPSSLDAAYHMTSGWPAALYTLLVEYRNNSALGDGQPIRALIRAALWQPLSQSERHFLLAICQLDRFTTDQVLCVLAVDTLPDDIQTFIEDHAFIRWDGEAGAYAISGMFLTFLRAEFLRLPAEDQRARNRLMGDAWALADRFFEAAHSYYRAGDIDALLSIPYASKNLMTHTAAEIAQLLLTLLNESPADTLQRHPQALLTMAFYFLMLGHHGALTAAMGMVRDVLDAPASFGIGEEALERLRGEHALMTALLSFNHVARMGEGCADAYRLLGGPTRLYNLARACLCGQPSMLYLYWSGWEPLIKAAGHWTRYSPILLHLTGGGTAGADCVLHAEVLLSRGDDLRAESLCYKALYVAASNPQNAVYYAASFALVRIAVLRGNFGMLTEVMDHCVKRARADSGPVYEIELMTAYLITLLNTCDALPEWLLDPAAIEDRLYYAARPFAQMIHAKHLLIKKRYAMLLGVTEVFEALAQKQGLLLPTLYYLIYRAIAMHQLGRFDEAVQTLKRALSMALPEKIYLPFAENSMALAPILSESARDLADPKGMAALKKLSERQARGAEAVKSLYFPNLPALTPREREVALLAQNGLTNKEIAAQLFISSETVKMAMKKIFEKLRIKSRIQLENFKL